MQNWMFERTLARDEAGNTIVEDIFNKWGCRNREGRLVSKKDFWRVISKPEVKIQLKNKGYEIKRLR